MKIFPAIDLLDGEVVRLEEGKREEKQTYGRPLEFARKFARNVDTVHVVDLDGAFSGEPQNLKAVRKMINETGLDVQYGGGLRSIEVLKEAKEAGVKNPVIGTKARDLEFLAEAAEIHDGLTVSLDVGEDGLMVEGWEKTSSLSPEKAFDKMKEHVDRFVFTAVNRDGKLNGIADVQPFWEERGSEVIYAGGVTAVEDLNKLEKRGFDGAIIGKALYEGEIELKEAVAAGGKDAG
ncbi:1-(5-phosphoribosyl)-5-((5-phosphoribosylamino)methylideneamino)imidazole-4-carboxamide isomerase [Candidatus Bipolaricaulota bacterium]|nr:1-(5-phosphoribosyl)-5-((5-phosphoribosylamino)methylideneamino)imidazole-4-carboxamide isomerase [Candidatus Bipolaricaulota bacterium]